MAQLRSYVCVLSFIVLFAVYDVYATTSENGDEADLIYRLLERIDKFEANDAANKAKIAELEAENEREVKFLKSKMYEMEANFNKELIVLKDEVRELKTRSTLEEVDTAEQNVHDEPIGLVKGPKRLRRHGSNIRQYREFPEHEVAFYATHSDHDIHNLGVNQILLFQQTHTNLGKAYNNNTGAFVAPVDGTYVLHATIMGVDITASQHFGAHFDVNGSIYSRFYVTAYDQSSHMLVLELTAGQTVTVKNDTPGAGFIGQHYSVFSGFLLYQHFPGSIVGK